LRVELKNNQANELIRFFIVTTLISAYLLMSERSKKTFVKRYKGDNGILNLEE
jgi:hypothetical protein